MNWKLINFSFHHQFQRRRSSIESEKVHYVGNIGG